MIRVECFGKGVWCHKAVKECEQLFGSEVAVHPLVLALLPRNHLHSIPSLCKKLIIPCSAFVMSTSTLTLCWDEKWSIEKKLQVCTHHSLGLELSFPDPPFCWLLGRRQCCQCTGWVPAAPHTGSANPKKLLHLPEWRGLEALSICQTFNTILLAYIALMKYIIKYLKQLFLNDKSITITQSNFELQ